MVTRSPRNRVASATYRVTVNGASPRSLTSHCWYSSISIPSGVDRVATVRADHPELAQIDQQRPRSARDHRRKAALHTVRLNECRDHIAVEPANREILGDHPPPDTPRNRSSCSTLPGRTRARATTRDTHPRTGPPPRLQTRLRHRHRLLVEAAAPTIEMAQSDDGTMPIRLPASPRETQADQALRHHAQVRLGIVVLSAQLRLFGYPNSRTNSGSSRSWRR